MLIISWELPAKIPDEEAVGVKSAIRILEGAINSTYISKRELLWKYELATCCLIRCNKAKYLVAGCGDRELRVLRSELVSLKDARRMVISFIKFLKSNTESHF